jgi:hypothetical protein
LVTGFGVTGVDDLTEERTLESIVDPFVKRVGGERISEIVGNVNPPSSADYCFVVTVSSQS